MRIAETVELAARNLRAQQWPRLVMARDLDSCSRVLLGLLDTERRLFTGRGGIPSIAKSSRT
jgi:hypothetical protein